MSEPPSRDWTDQQDGPPSLEAATTLVASSRRLLVRAALPTGLLAVLVIWASYGVGDTAVGSVIAALLLTASVARTVWWARGFGARTLLATPTHLVLCRAGVPEQWAAWSEIERVTVVKSDPLPEWSRKRTQWFHVDPRPETAVMPPHAFAGGFGDMLVSSLGSRTAAERVRRALHARGIPCELA